MTLYIGCGIPRQASTTFPQPLRERPHQYLLANVAKNLSSGGPAIDKTTALAPPTLTKSACFGSTPSGQSRLLSLDPSCIWPIQRTSATGFEQEVVMYTHCIPTPSGSVLPDKAGIAPPLPEQGYDMIDNIAVTPCAMDKAGMMWICLPQTSRPMCWQPSLW